MVKPYLSQTPVPALSRLQAFPCGAVTVTASRGRAGAAMIPPRLQGRCSTSPAFLHVANMSQMGSEEGMEKGLPFQTHRGSRSRCPSGW